MAAGAPHNSEVEAIEPIRLISEEEVSAMVSLDDASTAIESVFALYDSGEGLVFSVATGTDRQDSGNFFAIKSGAIPPLGLVGCKIGTYWPANVMHGIPAHSSTIIALDPATGFPRAAIAANLLTSLRTAAADAIAVKYLARRDAATLGVIGAGHQAYYNARAACLVRRFEKVLIWSRSDSAAQALAGRLRNDGIPASAADRALVAQCDVISTVTPARESLVQLGEVRPGAHISAMGADARGKQELDPRLVGQAACFCDSIEQSVTIGEFEAAFEAGILDRKQIRTIGSVIRGHAVGRRDDKEITIFDSSGIALQDLAMADLVLRKLDKPVCGESSQ